MLYERMHVAWWLAPRCRRMQAAVTANQRQHRSVLRPALDRLGLGSKAGKDQPPYPVPLTC
jgi:hypothetical protein